MIERCLAEAAPVANAAMVGVLAEIVHCRIRLSPRSRKPTRSITPFPTIRRRPDRCWEQVFAARHDQLLHTKARGRADRTEVSTRSHSQMVETLKHSCVSPRKFGMQLIVGIDLFGLPECSNVGRKAMAAWRSA